MLRFLRFGWAALALASLASSAWSQDLSGCDDMGKQAAELEREWQELDKRRADMVFEMMQGMYCSKCKRSKSEIERAERLPFSQHLEEVNGVGQPAPISLIKSREKDYLDKIADLKRRKSDRDQARRECIAAAQEAERRRRDEEAEERWRRQQEAQRKAWEEGERRRKAEEERQRRAEAERQQRVLAQTQARLDQLAQQRDTALGMLDQLGARLQDDFARDEAMGEAVRQAGEVGDQVRERNTDALPGMVADERAAIELEEQARLEDMQLNPLEADYLSSFGGPGAAAERPAEDDASIRAWRPGDGATRTFDYSSAWSNSDALAPREFVFPGADAPSSGGAVGDAAAPANPQAPREIVFPGAQPGSASTGGAQDAAGSNGPVNHYSPGAPSGASQPGAATPAPPAGWQPRPFAPAPSGAASLPSANPPGPQGALSAAPAAPPAPRWDDYDFEPPTDSSWKERLLHWWVQDKYEEVRDTRLFGAPIAKALGRMRTLQTGVDWAVNNPLADDIPEDVRQNADIWRMLFLPHATGDFIGAAQGKLDFLDRWVDFEKAVQQP